MDVRSFAEISQDALLLVEGECIAYVNPVAERRLGSRAGGWIGRPPRELGALAEEWPIDAGRRLVRLAATEPATEAHDPALVVRALDVAGEAIVVTDIATRRYLYANAAAARLLHLPLDDLLRRGPIESVARLEGEPLDEAFARVMAAPLNTVTVEVQIVRVDGTAFLAEVARSAARLGDRRVVISCIRDTTAPRAQAERVERLSLALDLSADGVLLVEPGSWAVLDANQACCDMLRLDRDRLLGRVVHGPGWPHKDAAGVAADFQRVLARHPQPLVLEVRGRRTDGSSFPVEASLQAFRLRGEWVMNVTLRDVSERRAVQARLARIGTALDSSTDALFLVDAETGAYLDVNEAACRLLGRTREEMLGPFDPTLHLTPIDQSRALYREAIRVAPSMVRDERVHVQPDGKRVPYEILRLAFRSEGRWIIAATWRDLSERRAAELRLEQMEAAIAQASDSIVIIDPQSLDYVHVNEAASRLWRVPRDEMLARGPVAVWERWGRGAEHYRRIFQGIIDSYPAAEVVDDVMTNLAGDRVVVERNRRAVRVHGKWLIIAISRDVTERRAERDRLKRLEAAVNRAADGISIVDAETVSYVEVNESLARLFGVSREDLMRRNIALTRELIGLDESAQRSVIEDAIATSPRPLVAELQVRQADGSARHVEATRQAVQIEGRWYVTAVWRDITERKAAQARLDIMSAAIDQASDAIAVIDFEAMEFVALNRANERIYQTPRDVAMRQGLRWAWREWGLDLETLRGSYQAIVDHPARFQRSERAFRQRNGTEIVLELDRRAVQHGGRWYIMSSARDITERKASQARLEVLSAAIDQAADAISVLDPYAMEFVAVNNALAAMYGLSKDELLARGVRASCARIGHDPDVLQRAYLDLVERSPHVQRLETTYQLPDGSQPTFDVYRLALRHEERWYIITSGHDVTDHKQAQWAIERHVQELSRSNQELEQFAYVASHDLSEPLRMVASYTQLLQKRYGAQLDDDATEFMGYIVDGARRMKQLINDLLLYSRAGRTGGTSATVRLDEALDAALANLAHAILESGARIERAPLPAVGAERVAMVQLLQNLVGNAVKFRGSEAPVVRIASRDNGDAWEIEVADNGIGVDPAYFHRLFVIFQRLHARGQYDGTGIGLAICKKIVDRYGGRIWIESAPGKGASFRFTLPKTRAAEPRPPTLTFRSTTA